MRSQFIFNRIDRSFAINRRSVGFNNSNVLEQRSKFSVI
jgi:hypothetical protein